MAKKATSKTDSNAARSSLQDVVREPEQPEDMAGAWKSYRQQHFAVEVRDARHPEVEGGVEVAITHNGNHWQVVELAPDEILKVVAALQARLPNH